uniref:Uncharacterized protein n=1 Tax=Rhizophora mucronata TaxID=61149 RepID=A0A2P2PJP0_RHIMU
MKRLIHDLSLNSSSTLT